MDMAHYDFCCRPTRSLWTWSSKSCCMALKHVSSSSLMWKRLYNLMLTQTQQGLKLWVSHIRRLSCFFPTKYTCSGSVTATCCYTYVMYWIVLQAKICIDDSSDNLVWPLSTPSYWYKHDIWQHLATAAVVWILNFEDPVQWISPLYKCKLYYTTIS